MNWLLDEKSCIVLIIPLSSKSPQPELGHAVRSSGPLAQVCSYLAVPKLTIEAFGFKWNDASSIFKGLDRLECLFAVQTKDSQSNGQA
jgi:hypothetical protein